MAIATSFDAPIYKVLANNDTGAAKGHQGGFVLPKDLEDYLPLLRNMTSPQRPTVDVEITADLFDGDDFLGTADTRYQYQTWGGVRSPERRITRNLSGLLNRAQGGDILIIERGIEVDDHYRFTLIKESSPLHSKLIRSFGSNRWGVLDQQSLPAKETEVIEAVEQIESTTKQPFSLFEHDANLTETRARKVARSRAFKRVVSISYANSCAFCGGGLQHPDGRFELDASHIVSRSLKGSDDIRNGLLLCKGHHWAFDNGLIGVTDSYKLLIPHVVRSLARNVQLVQLDGREISLPKNMDEHPAAEALAWHRRNILVV
ncbi:HNH endonuclease [Tsuneonella mangrovi]|uniref:HNH endonuclease n=1 Tax=Tsuneonella mangrovi TaxID=1982042 RepID=UPI000BA26E3A|nr:HNH endonuclease [Tsuneonella mangrovi]